MNISILFTKFQRIFEQFSFIIVACLIKSSIFQTFIRIFCLVLVNNSFCVKKCMQINDGWRGIAKEKPIANLKSMK